MFSNGCNRKLAIKFICVLKSGGSFYPEYVKKLSKNLDSKEIEFICLTDIGNRFNFECNCIELKYNLEGWWSKLEIFQFTGKGIYFDLDTVLFKNPSSVIDLVDNEGFYMLEAFNKTREFASGIMAWNGDYSFLLNEIEDIDLKGPDHEYITDTLINRGVSIKKIERSIHNIYSYKRDILEKKIKIEAASILCFHGKPRMHEVRHIWDMI